MFLKKNNRGISQHENLYVRETLGNPLYFPLTAPWLPILTTFYALRCLKLTIKQLLITKKLIFIVLQMKFLPVPQITVMNEAVSWHAHTGLPAVCVLALHRIKERLVQRRDLAREE